MTNGKLRIVIGHMLLAIAPNALVEPEVVATSPCRIKSPVPVCCGFDSLKLMGASERRSLGEMQRTKLIRLPSEHIADNALRAIELASLTGFARVISGRRGRQVIWTTPQGQKW